MTTYWHGSPFLITDDYVVPGAELGRDNYGMSRNRSVFVTPCFHTAAAMGQPKAPYMYEVEPIDVYDRGEDGYGPGDAPHAFLLGDEELQCKRARIVRRFRNIQPTHDEHTRLHGDAAWRIRNRPHYAFITQAVLEDV